MTDPNLNPTKYSYADSYSSCSGSAPPAGNTAAYLTQVTFPPTNGVAHIQTFCWGYDDGQIRGSTDQNGQTTLFQYVDSLHRLTQITYPDSGLTTVAYNDSPFSASANTPNFAVSRLIKAGLSVTTTTAMDGMGHTVRTLLSDPEGTDITDTTYDGFARVWKVSNPYRTTGDPTYGITQNTYDAIGRTTGISRPDGSLVQLVPVANATTVTDETGKTRKSYADALGNLAQVFEDPNNLNYETDYKYDTLGNLLQSDQKGSAPTDSTQWRTRTFIYDWLSRPTTASNPESGIITYGYDLNSNLSNRIAPKPNPNSTGTVTTNYYYDALNRLTQKSYLNLTTPTAQYAYDGSTLTGCTVAPPSINSPTNLVGRRSAMCAGLSASKWSYDKMGRQLIEARTNKGSSNTTNTVQYVYNLDGSLRTLAYPSGKLLNYTVGGAERVTQVDDTLDIFAANIAYTPSGSVASGVQGPTVINNAYNIRLQPILLSASLSGGSNVFSLCYDFHLHVAINTSPCNFPAYTTGDNGTVLQVLNNIDSTRSAAYAYDSLNRIKQANTITTTGSNCWGEVYTIDSWGNLTNRAGVSGMGGCSTEGLSATATTNNQLSGIGMLYDAAGNVTNDGIGNTPTYDAENRMVTDAGFTYSYDADGIRMEKSSGSSGTMYWPSQSGEYLTETNLAGTINEEYIYFNGERIARVDRPSGTVHYYFSDRLGSASVIASSSGTVQEQYFYYPYGGMQSSIGSDSNHYEFTGKERDTESHFDNFGARYYGSNRGRFMTPDWAARPTSVPYAVFGDPQSLNLYGYVRNDPVSMADADGHFCDTRGDSSKCGREEVAYEESGTNHGAQEPPEMPAQNTTLQKAEGAVDWFNGTLGFAKSNCAGGGSCVDALGMAGTAILTAVVSDGASEEAVVEKQLATSSAKIERIAGRLTEETLDAANREVNGGMKVAKAGGGEFSHVEKVKQLMNGLDRQAGHLERVLQRSGLSESQVGRINGVIERARSLLGIAQEAITKDPI